MQSFDININHRLDSKTVYVSLKLQALGKLQLCSIPCSSEKGSMHIYVSTPKKVFLRPDPRMCLRDALVKAVSYLPDPLKNDDHSITPINCTWV